MHSPDWVIWIVATSLLIFFLLRRWKKYVGLTSAMQIAMGSVFIAYTLTYYGGEFYNLITFIERCPFSELVGCLGNLTPRSVTTVMLVTVTLAVAVDTLIAAYSLLKFLRRAS